MVRGFPWLTLLLVAGLAGCGGDGNGTSDGGGSDAGGVIMCTPGEEQACSCQNGATGVARCLASAVLGRCMCPDAGANVADATPSPDAVVTADAARPDAVVEPDAAEPMDATPQDAVVNPDADTQDAATPDAVAPDAVVAPDATPPDQGFPDATPPDQGFPDADPPDLGPDDTGIHPDADGTPDADLSDTSTTADAG